VARLSDEQILCRGREFQLLDENRQKTNEDLAQGGTAKR